MAEMSDNLCYLTNDDLEFQYDALKEVLETNQLLDVPIAIFSIAGSTKTGKSYLLNVLSYLLSNRHSQVNRVENDNFQIPQKFKSIRQPNSVTKGICMTSKPIIVEIGHSKKIAVFFMDTQGIEAGDKIECKEADIFTISSSLSYMQMINVQNLLRWKDVDSYAALTLFAKQMQDTMDRKAAAKTTKLLTVVRDWQDPDTYPCGNEGGRNYLRSTFRDERLKKQVECWKSCFTSTDCFLVSHPGKKVATTNSKLKSAIDKETWLEILNLFNKLFSLNALQEAFGCTLKGKDLLRLAQQLEKALASPGRSSAPESSFMNFLDLVMKQKVTTCFNYYKNNMKNFIDLKGSPLTDKHNEVNRAATVLLETNNSAAKVQDYVKLLHSKTNTEYQIYGGRHLIEKYAKEWAQNIAKKGYFKTEEVIDFFRKEGNQYIDLLNKEVPDVEARNTVINEFIELLETLYKKEFKRRQENQRIAIRCGATILGLLGAGFIPLGVTSSRVVMLLGACASIYSIAPKEQNSAPPNLRKSEDDSDKCEEETKVLMDDIAEFFSLKKRKQD